MNIDVEAFGLYLAVIVAGILLVWSVWPAIRDRKKEVIAPEPEPFMVPPPVTTVAQIKPAPVPSLEPVVAPEPIPEPVAVVETPAPEPVKEKTPRAKKPAVKKETSFVPPAAPKPKKAPAKKAPKK